MGKFINVCSGVNLHNMPKSYPIEALLLNTPAAGKDTTSLLNAATIIAETNAEYFYLDSGGYEIFKQVEAAKEGKNSKPIYFDRDEKRMDVDGGLNITPKHIYETGLELKPSVFISLDYPIPGCPDSRQQELHYLLTMGFNLACAREMYGYIEKYRNEIKQPTKFYIALQCYNLQQMNHYLNNLENIQFDGISIPKRVHTPTSLSLFLFHIYRRFYLKGLPDIHLLGSTKFQYLAVLAYFARNIFPYISVDATSWAFYSRVMLYVYPLDLRDETIGDDAILYDEKTMECKCPACSSFVTLDDLKVQDVSYKKKMLYGHNWHVINEAMNLYYEHAESAASLNQYLLSIINRNVGNREKEVAEIFRCLTIIEAMMKNIDDDKMISNLSRMLDADHAR